MFFFFFQAEDGIRDSSVTGVQTCALPICDVLAAGLRQRVAAVLRVGVDLDLPAEDCRVELPCSLRVACREIRPYGLVSYRGFGFRHFSASLNPRDCQTQTH